MNTASESHYGVWRAQGGIVNEVEARHPQRPHLGLQNYAEGVYEFLRAIPPGKVATYKQVAEYLGNPKLARVVGNILHHNPDGEQNPCYKIVNSQGKLSGSFAFGGPDEQRRRLEADGIEVVNNRVDLAKYQYKS